ncbi:uncharacterized protein LOC109803825 isoform X2 [Cajanus cajan]|uniref:uncharacterized protein LOC109803825 isoform X2 n=1 Tax=Cajanus cajan TaxID=3821 RepID=UPI0010FB011D|nr:uncharacterized protein LOC109803825 isoform X2 [Cajanus cajan]
MEFPERGDLRRMQREQERERRRIRDRQRRQSMTQEQRERHLARRRRNYQLRRQRAANAHAPYTPFPHLQPLESSAGEASTSDEFQGVTSTFLDYGVLSQGIVFPHHGLNQGQETLNFGAKVGEGSSVPLETLVYKPANSTRRMRLNHIKCLARSLTHSIVDPAGTHQVAAELIAKEQQDVSIGNFGSTTKSLRLNCVKRLARSKTSPIESAGQKDLKLQPEEIQLLGNESFIASS